MVEVLDESADLFLADWSGFFVSRECPVLGAIVSYRLRGLSMTCIPTIEPSVEDGKAPTCSNMRQS